MKFKTQFSQRQFRVASIVSIAALLAACGGGSGGGTSAANSPVTPTYSSATVSVDKAETTSSNTIAAESSVTPATAVVSSSVSPYGQNAGNYALTFSDEFNGVLDTKVWNDHPWYEKPNATKNYTVENGVLKIWPQKDASGKFFNRTVDTDGRYTQTYGYFEIEAKLPIGKGTWPAFWLFNHIGTRRPEIDVMEAYAGGLAPWGTLIDGHPHPMMYASTIWKDATVQGGTAKFSTPDLSSGFHKYALKWEKNKQTFYFDGREVYSANVSMGDPMYLMLDLWFGSASGQPDNSTPQGKGNSYEVNYIRAWQFK